MKYLPMFVLHAHRIAPGDLWWFLNFFCMFWYKRRWKCKWIYIQLLCVWKDDLFCCLSSGHDEITSLGGYQHRSNGSAHIIVIQIKAYWGQMSLHIVSMLVQREACHGYYPWWASRKASTYTMHVFPCWLRGQHGWPFDSGALWATTDGPIRMRCSAAVVVQPQLLNSHQTDEPCLTLLIMVLHNIL